MKYLLHVLFFFVGIGVASAVYFFIYEKDQAFINQGARWTLEDHMNYAQNQDRINQDVERRLEVLETKI